MVIETDIPNWSDYFLNLSKVVATRSACYRAHVGCVVVRDHRVLSTGYNSAPRGVKTCFERKGCYREDHNIESGTHLEKCYAAGAHAEMNAIVNAARHGVSVEGATMYLTGHDKVCAFCRAAILNARIAKVVLLDRRGRKHYFIPDEDFVIFTV